METYDQIYQQLRASGEPAWTGSGYLRAWSKLSVILDTLASADHLPAPGSHILELGCGNGAMAALWFARRGYRVTGVDISPTAIDWARENFARQGLSGDFQPGNVCSLEGLAAGFDLIFDGSCLHCLIGEQRMQAWREIARLLKPGGRFVLSSMCGEPQQEEDRQHYDAQQHLLYRDGQPWRTLMPLELLRDEITHAGFCIQHQQVSHNPWWDHATLCVTAR
ncbi:class I SAM-dependent methyltransferase [Kosakonia sp. BK9b]|uniref:class I SAM-dependent methyltransferase n=1 Tax=Kosakonia sp. TaxID=1916651 RepID=UPI0028A005C2|nr:class I SAM-dependent methyltransferase [Kosakonia sp.]